MSDANWVAAPGREHIGPDPTYEHRPVALDGDGQKFLHKTMAAVRLNIERRTCQVRFIMADWGDSNRIITDDPTVFMDLPENNRERRLANVIGQLGPYAALMELCTTCLCLPQYFRFRVDIVRMEDPPRTQDLSSTAASSRHRRKDTQGTIQDPAFKIRRVAALRIVRTAHRRAVRRYTPPTYQVEVTGFWRTLATDSVGKDNKGNPVRGKTWVEGHLRWRDRPAKPREVLVKSRVVIARAIAESEAILASVQNQTVTDEQKIHESDAEKLAYSSANIEAPEGITREASYLERRKLTRRLRWRILNRDDFRCVVCGADAATDHSVPARSGPH